MRNNKRILIVRTDRIGDVVLTLPLANIIKNHLPDSSVSFLVRNYTSPVLQKNPSIDEAIILEEKNNKLLFLKNIKLLKSKKFDCVFIVNASFKIALIVFLAKIGSRIGTGFRWYSFLFNKKIFAHRKSGNKHELEYNVEMLEKIGITENINANNVYFNIQVDKNSKQLVNEFLNKSGVSNSKIRIIIHPGSGGSAFDLPKDKLKKMTSLLARELDLDVLVTGSKKEIHLCDYVVGESHAINCAGKFDLKRLIALIDSADILISNSTGPIHIAAALNIFVFGFYPTVHSMSKKRWGPYSNKSVVFEPDGCDGMTFNEFKNNNCMDKINIDEVFKSIKLVLPNFQKKLN